MSASMDNQCMDDLHSEWEDQVLSYVMGELEGAERIAFEAVLAQSALCRVRVFETQQLVNDLKTIPREKLPRDLTGLVLAKIREEKAPLSVGHRALMGWRAPLKIAATLLLLVCGVLLLGRTMRAPDSLTATERAVNSGLDWLVRVQEPSGAWEGTRWGGRETFPVGLTGLALLALAEDESAIVPKSHEAAIRRAANYLMRVQREDGRWIDPASGTSYDHAIATCALLAVYQRQPDAALKESLDKALRVLTIARDVAGGYGYQGPEGRVRPNVESAWTRLALDRSMASGWSMGGVYRSESADPPWSAAPDRILVAQETQGPFAGSWSDGKTAGGRVYATSMAALSLRATRDHTGS